VLATVLGFSCCTRRGNKRFFFSRCVACFVSVRDLFLLLWFCTVCEEKGPRLAGDSWRVFIPEFFFAT